MGKDRSRQIAIVTVDWMLVLGLKCELRNLCTWRSLTASQEAVQNVIFGQSSKRRRSILRFYRSKFLLFKKCLIANFNKHLKMSNFSPIKVQGCLISVDGGQRAVIFDRFSGVKEDVVGEGTHFLIPWVQRPIIFDIRSTPRVVTAVTGSKGSIIFLLKKTRKFTKRR